MTDKFNEKTDVFRELGPCLEYIYKNFGREVFFSGSLSAYVLDLGPSIEEYSVIRFLEKENILSQIETIESLDINDRNILLNDIIYKLPIHLNKDAFRTTLEVIILSLGVELDENKNKTQKDTTINISTHNSQNISSIANINTNAPKSNMYDNDMEPLDDESKQSLNELLKEDVDVEVDNILKNAIISETPPSEFDFDKSTGTIVKYLGTSKEIIIPEKIEGVPVKIIGDSSFENIGIEKINIPFGIESIGCSAFSKNKIETISLPNSLKSIEESAFFKNQIRGLNLPDGIESIGRSAFSFNKIEKLYLPESLKSIKVGAFYKNQIRELNLPDGIEEIGTLAFKDNKIEKLYLPESLKSLGLSSFKSNKLKEVYLPESIYKFGSIAFDHDVKINKITTLNTSTNNLQNVNSSANLKAKTQNSNMFDDDIEPLDEESKQNLNELLKDDVDLEVKKILENNEGKQNKDTEISETPSSEFEFDKNTGTIVKYLGTSKEITIPKKIEGIPVKILGFDSFDASGIEKINIPMGVEEIGAFAFWDNKIKTLTIPDSVKSIGESAFVSNRIEELILGENIENIGDNAFILNKLEEVYLPKPIYEFGSKAFDSDVKIKKKSFFNKIFGKLI